MYNFYTTSGFSFVIIPVLMQAAAQSTVSPSFAAAMKSC